MLSRSLTGNKVAPAPLEGSEASPAPAVADAAVSEGQSAVDRTSAGPADGACRPDTVNAPVPQSLPSVAHPAIQPSLPSRQQSLPARPTLLSAKSGISWPEDAKEGGSKPLAVSRVPKGRAQRFFPSATAVDKNYQLNKQARAMEVREGFVDVPQNSLLSQKFQKAARSKVGQRLTDLTILRVVLLVLLMLLLIPAFNVYSGVYGTQPNLNKGGLQVLHDLYLQQGDSPAFEVAKADYLTNMPWLLAYKRTDWVMDLVVCNQTLMRDLSGDGRRTVELATNRIQTPQCAQGIWEQCFVTIGVLNEYWNSQLNAALNILRTTFICLVIGGGAILLTRDANRLVLLPIERMLKKVKDVAENPLAKQVSITRKDTSGGMETRLLENSINKICSLLAIGFGDAGGQVIAKNMRSGGAIEPMIPGERVHAIFGFCDIRNFTDTTEVLQEGVMEFVNSIAEIVHQEVALHDGSPNKNIGDAFLLVWKLPPGFEPGLTAMAAAVHMADKALAAFVIIQAALKRSPRLQQYSQRADLNERMPDFQVKMGFGLHIGWAIEGAIGSNFKIDASYLSPNVNMASRLEAATKQFGTSILLSEDFVLMLSPRVRSRVRQIDRVTVKGSAKPMGLFTYDVALDKVYNDEFAEHPDLKVTWAVNPAFMERFAEGYTAYETGEWARAKFILEETQASRRDAKGEPVRDGPSTALLNFMTEKGFQAPPGWKGWRELTEK
ncbi:hypothetical protein WJX84_006069 [Apatococcus fuscideae]|uniref:Guanylate cyclase domain-containing protein n=1 Tax=Apatococcus fuscideae TaxID=2026836 RepID=A0AAW1RJ68_9CHLO